MLCNHCGQNRSQYSVVRHGGKSKARLCPPCFQRGLDRGRIIWIGRKAVAA